MRPPWLPPGDPTNVPIPSTRAKFRDPHLRPPSPLLALVRHYALPILYFSAVFAPALSLILSSLHLPRHMWVDLAPVVFIQHSQNPARYWCALAPADEHDYSCWMRSPDGLERFLAVLLGGETFASSMVGLWRWEKHADVDVVPGAARATGNGARRAYTMGNGVRAPVDSATEGYWGMQRVQKSVRLTLLTSEELGMLFSLLDVNKDGLVDFLEVIGGWDNWDHRRPWPLETYLDRWKRARDKSRNGVKTYGRGGIEWWSPQGDVVVGRG